MGSSGPAQTGIPLTGTVASSCSTTGWNLRPARSSQAELLHTHLTTVTLPSLNHEHDTFMWLIGDEELVSFSTKKTWEVLRQKQARLPWTDHVWYKGAIPRHAFMMWLTHLDRLPTRERLVNWGLQIDSNCCMCGLFLETRDHLFLHCEVSQDLWSKATRRLGYNPFTFQTWEVFSSWLDLKDNTSPRLLRRLVAHVMIYAIWMERNSRYHNNVSTDSQVLFKVLDRQVRDAILAKKRRNQFKNLMRVWLKYD